jgi:formate hydrogenlyase subunit 6/NADH:ubiquinone oxidoreductase subunit I
VGPKCLLQCESSVWHCFRWFYLCQKEYVQDNNICEKFNIPVFEGDRVVEVIRHINGNCINCGRCMNHCPVGAIEESNNQDHSQNWINLKKCKKCCFCYAEAFCMYKAFFVHSNNTIDELSKLPSR